VGVGWDDDQAVSAWAGLPVLDGDRTADAARFPGVRLFDPLAQ
jgi:hypothetical protein